MPKRKIGCVNCLNKTVELKLIKMIPDEKTRCFQTTYQCPICDYVSYDVSSMNESTPMPDEIQPVDEARKARERYLAKLQIHQELEKETDEEKIKQLKQDEFYDPDFDPDDSEVY